MRQVLSSFALVVLAACHPASRSLPEPTPPSDTIWSPVDRTVLHSASMSPSRSPGACATLKDVESADILKVTRGESDLALYADPEVGLLIVDVADPDAPSVLATSAFIGGPTAVFEHQGAAIVVYTPRDRLGTTVVRAVSLARRTIGAPLGEVTLAGTARDAYRVDDTIVVTRNVTTSPKAGPDATALTALTLDANGLKTGDELLVSGGGASTGASPSGLAVAREADATYGPDRTVVTWIAAPGDGVLQRQGTIAVSGVVPGWRRATDHAIDVTEDGQVRVIGCTNVACTMGEPATYASIDFSRPSSPVLAGWASLSRATGGVFAFSGSRLFVARPPVDGTDATELAVFRTEHELVPQGTIRLDGIVGSMIARDESVIALGWTGIRSAQRRAVVHHVDVRRAPRRVGSVAFGGDWTWTPAFDDDRAMSFDPNATLAALPMTTLREHGTSHAAVQVLSFAPTGPKAIAEREVTSADRVLFVDGRLLAFSADGVVVVGGPNAPRVHRTWGELGGLQR